MRLIHLSLHFVLLAVFLMGCSSSKLKSSPVSSSRSAASSDVAQSPNLTQASSVSSSSLERTYEDSFSCKMMESVIDPYERERMSALTGFAVGPRTALQANDLKQPMLRPFISDGCSSSPDGVPLTENSSVWVDCCIRHDTAYWMGGTHEQKKNADNVLRSCIASKGYSRIGKLYKSFVDEFGGPRSTQNYRWGYGWNGRRDFSPLTSTEKEQIKNLYGVDETQFPDFMMAQPFSLQRMCDTFDPIFYGLRKEEIKIYHFLNSRLKNNDVIVGARLYFFNQDYFSYEIRLKSCTDSVIVTVFEDRAQAPTFQPSSKSTCQF